jgi:hypothetical protein
MTLLVLLGGVEDPVGSSGDPASLPHLGLVLATADTVGSTDYPGPLPHIGALLTGSTAAVLPAETTTYAIAGQDATLAYRYKLTAEQGTYSVSGQDVALQPSGTPGPGPLPHLALLGGLGGARLVAESGTYDISGQDQGLLYSRSLVAELGYIAIYGQVGLLFPGANSSGEAAPLPHLASLFLPTTTARTLTCDPGSYAYVGSDGLSDLEMSSPTEAYAIDGQDVALLRGYSMVCEAGDYQITGYDADSQISGVDLVMQADYGTYDITGTDNTLYSGYGISAEQGFYALLGQDAITSVGGSIDTRMGADTGYYTVAGYDATLTSDSDIARLRLDAESGVYLCAGQDAGWFRTYRAFCAGSTYTVHGRAASLRQLGDPVPSDWVPIVVGDETWTPSSAANDIWTPVEVATGTWTSQ